MRALFRTGDGQTTARRNAQSLFNDITEGERKGIDKGGGKIKKRRDMSYDYQVHLFKDDGESEFRRLSNNESGERMFNHYLCEWLQSELGCVWAPQP